MSYRTEYRDGYQYSAYNETRGEPRLSIYDFVRGGSVRLAGMSQVRANIFFPAERHCASIGFLL
jgi:hypothetical protein